MFHASKLHRSLLAGAAALAIASPVFAGDKSAKVKDAWGEEIGRAHV